MRDTWIQGATIPCTRLHRIFASLGSFGWRHPPNPLLQRIGRSSNTQSKIATQPGIKVQGKGPKRVCGHALYDPLADSTHTSSKPTHHPSRIHHTPLPSSGTTRRAQIFDILREEMCWLPSANEKLISCWCALSHPVSSFTMNRVLAHSLLHTPSAALTSPAHSSQWDITCSLICAFISLELGVK